MQCLIASAVLLSRLRFVRESLVFMEWHGKDLIVSQDILLFVGQPAAVVASRLWIVWQSKKVQGEPATRLNKMKCSFWYAAASAKI